MKTFATILYLLLVLNVSAYAQQAGPKSKEEWIAIINKDAKLSSLVALLGRPDNKLVKEDTRYDWDGKLDTGTTQPRTLKILAHEYKGEMIIWSIWDPVADTSYNFPWADKVRGGF